ncbi:MAG: spore maturation protein [Ferruginibacter sp.]|nr:spore maturation protein [Ferruginibacter sp.]
MALSRIWSAFIIIAIVTAGIKCFVFPGNRTVFANMVTGKTGDTIRINTIDSAKAAVGVIGFLDSNKVYGSGDIKTIKAGNGKLLAYKIQSADGIVETCQTAVTLSLKLIGFLALFMGFLSIAERAGGIRFLSRIIGPFFSKLFPEIPKGHPSMGLMIMNFSANLLGLDNAATPFGIKAMESLQEINPHKEKASNPQIMFLCLHASGLTLIPVSIIALRSAAKATNPMDIFLPCMIATFVATIAAMLIVSFKQKINLLQPVILGWVLGISAIIAMLVVYIRSLDAENVQVFSGSLSSGMILFIFIVIVFGGLYKKIDIFDSFIEGARGGFETAVRIIPYLVGMLVAISLLRTSGSFDAVINGIKNLFGLFGTDTRFVDGLPTALVKPFSGGAARGMMVDTMKAYGADSFAGRLACVLQGSSDTTFYVIAVYFGAVSVKNTRYAISAMLLADLVGIVTSIGLAYLFFG